MPDTKTAKQGTAIPAILRALPGPKGDLWATVAAVADAVGKGYSTVTENLRTMAIAGQVESRKLGRNTVWRRLVTPPKLKRDDVPVPRAHTVTVGDAVATTKPEAPGADAAELAAVTADAGDQVWMATRRRGLNYHIPAADNRTACHRSTHAGVYLPVAEVRDTSPLCPVCERAAVAAELDRLTEPAESPAEAPEPVAVPQPPPAANTPTGGEAGAVMAFMESVRPVSAAPAEPVRKARRPHGQSKTYAVFGRGELQAAILSHVQALPEGTDTSPYQVATALNAYPGAVAYGLGRLEIKGNVRKTSEQPQRFAAV
jgi:hypothetical protein